MRKHKRNVFSLVMLSLFLVALPGCTVLNWLGLTNPPKEEAPMGPHQLAAEGMDEFNDRHYKKAIELFKQIKDRYPYSKYAVLAELKTADAHYSLEEYVEAAFEYQDFEKLHPKNDVVPYVIYQTGMCYYNQMLTIDRDQSATESAAKEFERLARTYPNSDYAVKAKARRDKCIRNLADHEYYIGEFYFKSKHYQAALGRFKGILEKYPDVGQYYDTMNYIQKCKAMLVEKAEKEAAQKIQDKKTAPEASPLQEGKTIPSGPKLQETKDAQGLGAPQEATKKKE
ncbi:MAG: outer membrane protein assembly factor BamD [Deltaproteobacteria bacterium]|nr:outer membrane protein assembly factor BamD [Deltaproteobacteria bacterium]